MRPQSGHSCASAVANSGGCSEHTGIGSCSMPTASLLRPGSGTYPSVVDAAEWDEAIVGLGLAAQEVQLMGRLLDVTGHLGIGRTSGDRLEGTLAADSLDQALGLLQELADGGAARLVATVEG